MMEDDPTPPSAPADRLRRALFAASSSDRLQAALSAGTYPDETYVEVLIERCAIEPDFFVRDMLTWSLTRHPAALTVHRLVKEAQRVSPQARSQALHSLSKIADPGGWAAITDAVLTDADESVARTAWRAAVVLVPDGTEAALAATLATQLGRGDRETRLALSRALGELGEYARPALQAAATDGDVGVRIHAIATTRLLDDPDEGFDAAIFEAERIVILG